MSEHPTEIISPRAPAPQDVSDPSQTAHAHAPIKRIKTKGERRFDLYTYGGYALLGNEATSLGINKAVEHPPLKGPYEKFVRLFTQLEGKPGVPRYITSGRMPAVLLACVGGMFMVPFIKYNEDHKGEIVRRYDHAIYGPDADRDPAIAAAHAEMDDAPKQSWGSLWKGRAVTVLAALGVDSLVGWRGAPSVELLKNRPILSRFSSMDHLAEQVSHGVLKLFKTTEKARPLASELLKTGSWLLILSTTLTALFYGSSKLFARRRDERLERKQEHLEAQLQPRPLATPTLSQTETPSLPEAAPGTAPAASVHACAHQGALNPAHETALQPSLSA